MPRSVSGNWILDVPSRLAASVQRQECVAGASRVRALVHVYVMAFGPSRHRAWVVGHRPLGCI
eukprot:5855784-Pyramimonas_sp.AAC.1